MQSLQYSYYHITKPIFKDVFFSGMQTVGMERFTRPLAVNYIVKVVLAGRKRLNSVQLCSLFFYRKANPI
jgi:hypothetical protein